MVVAAADGTRQRLSFLSVFVNARCEFRAFSLGRALFLGLFPRGVYLEFEMALRAERAKSRQLLAE
jgi:hypothetical protein